MHVEFCGRYGYQGIERIFCVALFDMIFVTLPIFLLGLACTSKLRVFAHDVPERSPKIFPGFRFGSLMMEIDTDALQVHKNCTTVAFIRDPFFFIFLTGDADASSTLLGRLVCGFPGYSDAPLGRAIATSLFAGHVRVARILY
jgi:hypothetical protein